MSLLTATVSHLVAIALTILAIVLYAITLVVKEAGIVIPNVYTPVFYIAIIANLWSAFVCRKACR